MRKFVLPAAALLLAAASVHAVELQPGTYTLEWSIARDTAPLGLRSASLRMITQDSAARIRGLASDRAFIGYTENYTIVIDESGGTGAGYDTAYIIVGAGEDGKADLAEAVKLPLSQKQGVLASSPEAEARIDISMGEEGSRITRQAAVSVEVYWQAKENDRPTTGFAILHVHGEWRGTVPTDTGALTVRAYDMNGNGVYGDRMTVGKGVAPGQYPSPGDVLVFGSFPTQASQFGAMVYLGKVNLYQGRLYVFEMSKTGETLRILPYEGERGTLSIRASDGAGNPAECLMAMVYGDCGMYFLDAPDNPLPPGEYACMQAQVMPRQEQVDQEKLFGLMVRGRSTTRVAANATAVMKVGGPISMVVEPKSNVVSVKRGQSRNIEIVFTVGGAPLIGVMGDRNAWVNIRDSGGKLLSSGQSSFG